MLRISKSKTDKVNDVCCPVQLAGGVPHDLALMCFVDELHVADKVRHFPYTHTHTQTSVGFYKLAYALYLCNSHTCFFSVLQ